MTAEQHGIITRLGWEEKDGNEVFTATVEFPNGAPEGETFSTIWDAIPVQIIKIDELYALRDAVKGLRAKLAAAEARAEKAEGKLSFAVDWIKGIPCLGRPGLMEDRNAMLRALAQEKANG